MCWQLIKSQYVLSVGFLGLLISTPTFCISKQASWAVAQPCVNEPRLCKRARCSDLCKQYLCNVSRLFELTFYGNVKGTKSICQTRSDKHLNHKCFANCYSFGFYTIQKRFLPNHSDILIRCSWQNVIKFIFIGKNTAFNFYNSIFVFRCQNSVQHDENTQS